jgi:hypothetical protein
MSLIFVLADHLLISVGSVSVSSMAQDGKEERISRTKYLITMLFVPCEQSIIGCGAFHRHHSIASDVQTASVRFPLPYDSPKLWKVAHTSEHGSGSQLLCSRTVQFKRCDYRRSRTCDCSQERTNCASGRRKSSILPWT